MAAEIGTWQIGGLLFRVRLSAILGSLLLAGVLSVLAWWLLSLPVGESLLLGTLATIAHWILDLVHQLGHAWAAKQVGYPMIGIRFWWVLSTCLYPDDEPPLSKRIHIRRVLGGPTWSLVILILAGIWIWSVWPLQGLFDWLAGFILTDSLLTFTLGALLPLGFTDGSTLLRLWKD